MHGTLFLISLFSSPAHAEEEVESCPEICEGCIASTPDIDGADDTCCIHSEVTLNRGCDIELGDRPLHIGNSGSLTVQGDTTIQASHVHESAHDLRGQAGWGVILHGRAAQTS